MNRTLATILTVSLAIGASGAAPALRAAEPGGPPEAPAQTLGQAAEPQRAAPAAVPQPGDQPAAGPAAVPDSQAVTDEGDGEPDGEAPAGSQGAKADAVATPATDKEAAPAKTPEPVTGAFGIPLGERFEAYMVAKVISQEEKTYRGPNKEERKGILYRVEPKVTNTLFNSYAVATTADGLIYLIRGDREPVERKAACQEPKTLAAFLEGKYGKPRGKGPAGEWYSFRDMSSSTYRGVRIHATRCGRGIYSVVYSDDATRLRGPVPSPEPSETSGL